MKWINLLPEINRTDGFITRLVYKHNEKSIKATFSYLSENDLDGNGLIQFSEVSSLEVVEFDNEINCKLMLESGILYEKYLHEDLLPDSKREQTFKDYLFFSGTPQLFMIKAKKIELIDMNFKIS